MAKLSQQLHNSRTHATGFDPQCAVCLKEEGISGIIDHLDRCARQNEADAKTGAWIRHSMAVAEAGAVAAEQRRMLAILKAYRMHCEAS